MPSPDRPQPDEYRPEFARYVARVEETDVLTAMTRQGNAWSAFLAAAPARLADHRYAPDKWTVRQVVAHVLDTERVMAYRALAIARGDEQPLPGMDEDSWQARMGKDTVSLDQLGDEWTMLRGANVRMFERLEPAIWLRRGVASGHPITVRALAYVMTGHVRHHAAVLREKYGVAAVPA